MPPVQLSAVASMRSRSQALASRRRVASSTASGSTGERVSVSFKRLALPGSARGTGPLVRMFPCRNQEGFQWQPTASPRTDFSCSPATIARSRICSRSFEKASGAAAKEKIVKEICTELKIHTQIEEEIYYPAIRGKVEEDALDEAYVEHDSAKLLINELEAAEPDEDFYDAKVKVLQELIEHHVKEEEKAARQSVPADPRRRYRPRGARRTTRRAQGGADGAGRKRGPAAGRAGDAEARRGVTMAWTRNRTIIAAAGATVAGLVAAVFTRRWWGGDGEAEEPQAAAHSRGKTAAGAGRPVGQLPARPGRKRCATRPRNGTTSTSRRTKASRPATRRRSARGWIETASLPVRARANSFGRLTCRRLSSSQSSSRAWRSSRIASAVDQPQEKWAAIISALRRSGMAGRRLQDVESGNPAHIAAEPDRAAGGGAGIAADARIGGGEQGAAAGAVGEMGGEGEVGRRSVARRSASRRRSRAASADSARGRAACLCRRRIAARHRHRADDAGDGADQEARAELHRPSAGRLIISQKMASTEKKAGKPKANQRRWSR